MPGSRRRASSAWSPAGAGSKSPACGLPGLADGRWRSFDGPDSPNALARPANGPLANGQQVVKSFRYHLTDPRPFDIMQSGPGWGDRMQFDQLKRREFFTLLGGAAAWPLAARAQQPGKLPVIGYMGQGTPAAEAKRVAAFVERLRELSWIEGRTVVIEYRWTDGRSDLAADFAAEFARRKVDIIVTSGTPLIVAAKQATATIPIVFSVAGDPVGSGLVASLARPDGNVTGLSVVSTDLAGKRLDLLRELVPGLRRVAIIGNVGNPVIAQELGEYQAAAHVLGLKAITSEIRRVTDI